MEWIFLFVLKVWGLALMKDKYLVAGSTGNEMPVYKISKRDETNKQPMEQLQNALETITINETEDDPTVSDFINLN